MSNFPKVISYLLHYQGGISFPCPWVVKIDPWVEASGKQVSTSQKQGFPPAYPGRSCMKRQPSQNIKHRLTPPVQAGRGFWLRFQNSFLCMLVLCSVFLPEDSLTWARQPGPGYKSLSALLEETVGFLARGLGRPAPWLHPQQALWRQRCERSRTQKEARAVSPIQEGMGWWDMLFFWSTEDVRGPLVSLYLASHASEAHVYADRPKALLYHQAWRNWGSSTSTPSSPKAPSILKFHDPVLWHFT